MAILFNALVFDGAITGAAATDVAYSPAEMNALLGRAEKYYITARVAQASGTSPTLSITLEHSCDNVNWGFKSIVINSGITAGAITVYTGFDLGTATISGAFVRVKLALGGTSPSANLQVRLCGRSND